MNTSGVWEAYIVMVQITVRNLNLKMIGANFDFLSDRPETWPVREPDRLRRRRRRRRRLQCESLLDLRAQGLRRSGRRWRRRWRRHGRRKSYRAWGSSNRRRWWSTDDRCGRRKRNLRTTAASSGTGKAAATASTGSCGRCWLRRGRAVTALIRLGTTTASRHCCCCDAEREWRESGSRVCEENAEMWECGNCLK